MHFHFYCPCQKHIDHWGEQQTRNINKILVVDTLYHKILMYTTYFITNLLKIYFDHALFHNISMIIPLIHAFCCLFDTYITFLV